MSYVHASGFRYGGVIVKDVDSLQIILLAQHIVVHIVSRSHLQTTRTELNVNVFVLNNRNNAANEWYNNLLASEPVVLRVVRVDAHGHIAHNRFGACSGNHSIAAFGVLMNDFTLFASGTGAIVLAHIVLHVVELGVLLFIHHFLVRKCRLSLRIPVDHAHATVDEPLAVEINKHVNDALRAFFVHSKCSTIPVARCTHAAQLLQDDASMFLGPVPSVFQKFLAGQISLFDALLSQAIYHLGFGSD